MTASASVSAAADDAPAPSRLRKALWWAEDYLYAARRQAAILQLPWAIGRHRPTPEGWDKGSDDLPEVVLLPGVYEHWTFMRPLGDALSKAGVPLFAYGNFLTVAINFLILAFIIFLMVRQINRLKRQEPAPAAPAVNEELMVLREIRDAVRR